VKPPPEPDPELEELAPDPEPLPEPVAALDDPAPAPVETDEPVSVASSLSLQPATAKAVRNSEAKRMAGV
jgi:hypothetical protein